MTQNKYSTRYYSAKQENKISKELGLTKTSNSGATSFDKGDIKDENILMECKTLMKTQKSVSIQKEWLDKNAMEAQSMGRLFSLLGFNFGPGTDDYIIISTQDFNNLYTAWKDLNEIT